MSYGALADIGEEAVVQMARALVRLPSVTGAEEGVAQLLAEELTAAGLEVIVKEFAPGRSNVYASRAGAHSGRCILLTGHTDTVGTTGWREVWPDGPRSDPFSGAVVDGKLWGRGAADQKGGIAAVLIALRAVTCMEHALLPHIEVAFVGDEESGEPGLGKSEGMAAYVNEVSDGYRRKPDFAVYTEPTQLNVYTAQPGFMIGTVTVRGKASYFSYPWRGRDAIRDAYRTLEVLYEYAADLARRERHPTLGHGLMLVTGIRGGESVSVAERCDIDFIRTLLPDETLVGVRTEIDDLLHRLAVEQGVSNEISYTAGRDDVLGGTGFETGPATLEIARLMDSVREHAPSAIITGAPYWSELSLLREIGVPGTYFGPGDISVCHTPFEHVPTEDLVAAARSLMTFLVTPPREPDAPGHIPPEGDPTGDSNKATQQDMSDDARHDRTGDE
ncbi:MAG: M20 family metallopeptidase [Acidimicrobiales bacterium]